MQLTDEQLHAYIQDVLSFGPEQKEEYQAQIDNLKQRLTTAIHDNSTLGVTKINQAGSWRKGTALRPSGDHDIDIDLIVYLDVSEAKRGDVAALHELILRLLRTAYPQKDPADFTPAKKTVGLEFRTSGLLVDLVPVIPVKSPPGFVWQPEVGGGGTFQTSPDGQLEFIRACKEKDGRFAHVVRLAKRWRTYAELDALSSFAIELLVAHLDRVQGVLGSTEAAFRRFLRYVAQNGLRDVVSFPSAIRTVPKDAAVVRVCAPPKNDNKLTARLTDAERKEIVAAAHDAYQAVNHAASVERKGDTLSYWRGVLGPQFDFE
jgi:hypothetical protein